VKIAVAVNDGQVSEHFGHCQGYALYQDEGGDVRSEGFLESPPHEPGKLPLFLASHDVDLVMAGGMGPRAVELFRQNGIEVLLGVSGDADGAVERHSAGELRTGDSTCHHNEEVKPKEGTRLICVTSQGEGLKGDAEDRFGRSPYFVILDLETGEASTFENPVADAAGGAGPRAVQFVADQGAEVVITGQLGDKAADAMASSGIKAYSYKGGGKVSDAVRLFLEGELSPLN